VICRTLTLVDTRHRVSVRNDDGADDSLVGGRVAWRVGRTAVMHGYHGGGRGNVRHWAATDIHHPAGGPARRGEHLWNHDVPSSLANTLGVATAQGTRTRATSQTRSHTLRCGSDALGMDELAKPTVIKDHSTTREECGYYPHPHAPALDPIRWGGIVR